MDSLELFGSNCVSDLVDDSLGSNEVGELRNDKPSSPRTNCLNGDLGPHAECATSGFVGLFQAVTDQSDGTGGKIRSGDVLHDFVEG